MIDIQHNVQLQNFNTLHLASVVSHYVQVHSVEDLKQALDYAEQQQLNVMVLSGGSNVLLPPKIDALLVHMHLLGIEQLGETDEYVQLRVAAGQNWHEFVVWTTAHHMYGLQNLALIPGLVGAAPVQNIGAYGVEVGEFIDSIEVYDRQLKQFSQIDAADCHFSYRHSIFKDDPARYIIVAVVFKLLKTPQLKISYGDLKAAMGDDLTAENLQRQVISIRHSKLPDPREYPNAGSFFKNPIISKDSFKALHENYPQMPNYSQVDGSVKVAAGWLIDQSGWKGKRLDKVGMFAKQALVLVNYGDAVLQDVQATYRTVQKDVLNKFNIQLEPEPVLFNDSGLIQPH